VSLLFLNFTQFSGKGVPYRVESEYSVYHDHANLAIAHGTPVLSYRADASFRYPISDD